MRGRWAPNGAKGRAVSGDRPIGAAGCRPRHTMASYQNSPKDVFEERRRGGGGSGTQKFVDQKWPHKFTTVNLVFPHLGGGDSPSRLMGCCGTHGVQARPTLPFRVACLWGEVRSGGPGRASFLPPAPVEVPPPVKSPPPPRRPLVWEGH